MGLIKAGIGALGGTLADQWKEFFYCEALDKDVLMVKGQKRTGSRSSNTKGSDNIISNGSGIAVADGQCMIIVEQGEIVEVCAEPGEFTFDTSSEPSIFAGKFGESLKQSFATFGRRFTYGGDTGKDQRVYYFNTKELIDNKFGTANPVPFRVVDSKAGIDLDVGLRCSGVYSYRISDPIIFYKKVCGNVSNEYRRDELDTQLKTEFISALQPSLAQLSELELRPSQIIAHTADLEKAMHQTLSYKWGELRGLEVVSVALGSVTLPEDDQKRLQDAQTANAYSDPGRAAGRMVSSTANAMEGAANNPNGAMNGFIGMGMAQGMGGISATDLFAMNAQKQAQQAQQPAAAPAAAPGAGWTCPNCGKQNTGKFCQDCGTAMPQPAAPWTCPNCGKQNTGKFCQDCGTAKPVDTSWICPQCGKQNTGNFCDNCGAKKQ